MKTPKWLGGLLPKQEIDEEEFQAIVTHYYKLRGLFFRYYPQGRIIVTLENQAIEATLYAGNGATAPQLTRGYADINQDVETAQKLAVISAIELAGLDLKGKQSNETQPN
jgi:hypothetical protein